LGALDGRRSALVAQLHKLFDDPFCILGVDSPRARSLHGLEQKRSCFALRETWRPQLLQVMTCPNITPPSL